MNKGFAKIGFIIGIAIIVILGFLFVTNAFATQNEPVVDGCDHECPIVEWTDYTCPQGYFEHDDTCRKLVWNGHGFDWAYTDKIAGETFNVTYDKSQDPNKCHRPSSNTLKDDYGMSNDQKNAFNADNPEWKDSIDVVPEGYYEEGGFCYEIPDEPEICDDDSATNYGEEGACTYPEEDPCNPQDNQLSVVRLDLPIDCEEPEVPDEPTTPGNPPTFAGSSTEAPVCTNGNTTKVVANGHVIRGVNGDFSKAIVNAFITEGDSVNIYWRIVGDDAWHHSSANEYPDGIKPNGDKFISYQVNELDPNGDYDFGIEQKNGCGGGTIAVIKDGAVSKTFTVTSYE